MKMLFLRVFVFTVTVFLLSASETLAANLSFARIRYDRMKASTSTTLQITLVPTSVGSEAKILINFGSATLSAGQSATTASIPAGTVGLPGTLTAVGSGTSIVVSGVTDLTVGTTYAFNLTVGVTNPTAGTVTDTLMTRTSGDATIDSASVQARYISDDQVVITANVPPTFNFIFSGNTDAFTSDLGVSAVSLTRGIGISVSTNAARGWTGWIKSSNISLSSVTTGETIPTSGTVDGATSTCSGGTDCYVLSVGVTSGTGSGSLSADPEYAGNGTTTGGTFSTTYQPFASRTGKTSGDVIWFKALSSIIATKAAGADYTDTWTIVGAGNF